MWPECVLGFWLPWVVAFAGMDGNAEMRDGRIRGSKTTAGDHREAGRLRAALDHEQQIRSV